MAKKQRADKQKEKEKKEKIILAALVGVLVLVGAWKLPAMLKSGSSNTSAATTAQTTSTSNSTSPSATSSATAGSGSATVGSLPNESTYEPSAGQLSGFSLFNGRDPFGNATTSSGITTSPVTTSTKTSSTTTTPHGSYEAAKISINGTSQVVLPKGAFPTESPVFVLDSVTAKQITIAVNGGSFASGQAKVKIKKGKSVVLVNTVDSTRYVIKYIAPLTAAQALPSTSTTGTTGTTSGTTSGTTTSSTTSSTTT
jgi:hypothetical protein